MSTRVEMIRERLLTALAPTEIEVLDESHKHIGHAGARDGRGHFAVRLRSCAFEGLGPLARHRAVYEALGTLMQSDIHALSIKAQAPGES